MIYFSRSLNAISTCYPIINCSISKGRQDYRNLKYQFDTAPVISNPYRLFSQQAPRLKGRKVQPLMKSEEMKTWSPFPFWKMGAFIFGGLLFTQKERWISPAYCDSIPAVQNDNPQLSLQELKEKFNLEEDPESIRQWKKANPEDATIWYRTKDLHEDNPFRARVVNNQLLWQAFGIVDPTENGKITRDDMTPFADIYRKEEKNRDRTIIVNTGLHGGEDRKIYYAKRCCRSFILCDMELYKSHDPASIFPVSPGRPPYTHEDDLTKNMDILDAWCYSALTDRKPGFEKGTVIPEEEISRCRCGGTAAITFEEILASFGKLGYKGKIEEDRDISEVEITPCREEILNRLEDFSICYVFGDGGKGKSHISSKIEKARRNSLEYTDTVYIPLRSTNDWENFIDYVEKILNVGAERVDSLRNGNKLQEFNSFNLRDTKRNGLKIGLERYFSILGDIAEKRRKKILVVVDNIDTLDQNEKFKVIYTAIKSYKSSNGDNFPFQLLLTGREKSLEGIEEKHVVKISEFWTEEKLWELFSKNFLHPLYDGNKKSATNFIEKNKKQLIQKFEMFLNNTAIVLTMSRIISQSYRLLEQEGANETIKDISGKIISIMTDPGSDDYTRNYKMARLFTSLLEDLPVSKNISQQDARYICEVLALISDREISTSLWKEATSRRFDQMKFCKIVDALNANGVLKVNQEHGTVRMASNYNSYMRLILNNEWSSSEEKRETIQHQIKDITEAISIRLKEAHELKNHRDINENMRLLLGLMKFSFSFDKSKNPMAEEIKKEAKFLAAGCLSHMTYNDVVHTYRSFFQGIPSVDGYTLSPHLVNIFEGESKEHNNYFDQQIANLIDEFESKEITDISNIARELNNCYVISMNLGLNIEKTKLKDLLKSFLKDVDFVTKKEIQSNLDKSNINKEAYETLSIFPQVSYRDPTVGNAPKAQKWFDDNQKKMKKTKKAELKSQNLNEGLLILIQSLLSYIKVEEIDLSSNKLGDSSGNANSVYELLKYHGSLKTLDLGSNSLNNTENLKIILNGLEKNKSLTKLILTDNYLTNDQVKMICEALLKHKKIDEIQLHNNQFDKDGLNYLQELMQRNESISSITTNGCWRNYHDGTWELRRNLKGAVVRIYDKKAQTPGLNK